MLSETDFFARLGEWYSIGDVQCVVDHSRHPGEQETYRVELKWQYGADTVAVGTMAIHTYLCEAFWNELTVQPAHQNKGIYSHIVQAMAKHFPAYGITRLTAVPASLHAEAIFKSTGFDYRMGIFELDLEGDRIAQWLAFKNGGERPAWSHEALVSVGLDPNNS